MRQVPTSSGRLFAASKDDVLELIEANDQHFDVIWNLAAELQFLGADELKLAHTVMLGKIEDMSVPSDVERFTMQLEMAVNVLHRGGTVLCHCNGGIGRTGLAIAAIKYAVDGRVDFALATAKKYCDGPETEEQKEFVRKLT